MIRMGNLIICDYSNQDLHFLDNNGKVLTIVGTEKLVVSKFFSLGVDYEGHLLIGTTKIWENPARLHILRLNMDYTF